MQSLSRHLRPAPYPYGLLTLRLLGKLGGKNRQFLREPLVICGPEKSLEGLSLTIECSWEDNEAAAGEKADSQIALPLSIDRCVEILKSIALAQPSADIYTDSSTGSIPSDRKETIPWAESSLLWNCRIENVDLGAYSENVMEETKKAQAMASLTVVQTAIDAFEEARGEENDTAMKEPRTRRILMGLLFACAIEYTEEKAISFVKDIVARTDPATLSAALVEFLSEPSPRTARVGIDILKQILERKDSSRALSLDRELFCQKIVCELCEACSSSSWGRLAGVQDAICLLIETLGADWARLYEVKLVHASLLPIKGIPREMSTACVQAFQFFVRVCTGLYGVPRNPVRGGGEELFWDVLYGGGEKRNVPRNEGEKTKDTTNRPREELGRSMNAPEGRDVTKIPSGASGGTEPAPDRAGADPRAANDESGKPSSSDGKQGEESKDVAAEKLEGSGNSEDPKACQGMDSGDKNALGDPSESRSDDVAGKKTEESADHSSDSDRGAAFRPTEEVVRVVLHEIACPQQLVRYVFVRVCGLALSNLN